MMKRFSLLAAIILLLASCESDVPKRSLDRPGLSKSQPPIRIRTDKKGTLVFGDSVLMSISTSDTSLVIENIEISSPDNPMLLIQSTEPEIMLKTADLGGGEQRIKVKVSFADGQNSIRYKEFKVLAANEPRKWQFEVVRKYPHDPTSYTQGFLVYEGSVYEGTGNYGGSKIRKLDLASGKVLKEKEIESDYFGEGITIFNDKIYQLTYKASKGFVYDLNSFEREGEFIYNTYTSEGWGLTSNDSVLIASDGSSYLFILDPSDMSEIKRLKVFNDKGEINNINELEYRNGLVYANVYTTAVVLAIDPETGLVLDEYIANGIVSPEEATSKMDVLNGIAFNPLNGNFLLTGKYWTKIYEAKAIPRKES